MTLNRQYRICVIESALFLDNTQGGCHQNLYIVSFDYLIMTKKQGIKLVIAVVAILALMIIGSVAIGQSVIIEFSQQFLDITSGGFVQLTFPSGAIELACPEEGTDPTCLEDFKKPTIKGDAPDICVNSEPQPKVLNAFLDNLSKLQSDCLNAANAIGDEIRESKENVRCWLNSIPLPSNLSISDEDEEVVSSIIKLAITSCPSVAATPSLASGSGIPFTCQDKLRNLLKEVRDYCSRVESLWHYYNSHCINKVDCAGMGVSSEAQRKAFLNELSAVFRGAMLQLESIQNSAEWLNSTINGFKCSNICDDEPFTKSGISPPGINAPGQFVDEPRFFVRHRGPI